MATTATYPLPRDPNDDLFAPVDKLTMAMEYLSKLMLSATLKIDRPANERGEFVNHLAMWGP